MGRLQETQKMLEDAASIKQPSGGGSLYQGFLAELLVSRGLHDAALDVAKRLIASRGRDLGHAFAARALMGLGRADEARQHITELSGGIEGKGAGPIDVDLARGEFLLRTGQREAGARILSSVLTRARRQRTPDGWIEGLFTLETIFQIAYGAGDWDLARKAASLLMEHDKAYGGSHLANALIAEHDGKAAEVAAAFAEAARLWKSADADYEPARYVRKVVERHR
jgi:tetratricopeptide (TPR) repeat protein